MASSHVVSAPELSLLVEDAHRRTRQVVDDLDDAQWMVARREIVNPFLWELGHVAYFYEAFMLRELGCIAEPMVAGGADLYDSFTVEHDDRWELALPSRSETLDYTERVHELVLGHLGEREPGPRETYLALLAVHHEDMHGEAFAYMRQTLGYPAPPGYEPPSQPVAQAGPCPGDAHVPGGRTRLGADPELAGFVFDNEKWAHSIEVAPFAIARAPVTNVEFAEFVEDGGYARLELWSRVGWRWRSQAELDRPITWERGDSGWSRRDFDRLRPLAEHAPACHISWYEAEAYCNWAGRRLPTEVEWELAAAGVADAKGRYPWGAAAPGPEHANLDARVGGCVDVGAFPAGDSPFGCRQMLGNVWEWTSSAFYPYPGYVVDTPYREYSAPWFGTRKVLRGGSWATRSRLVTCTHRNFFTPNRNDIFAGFRTCAR
ncbi:MAG: ergothioneine biosynthesis protein EgtB [Planctomycetota bacterium]|nr:MAG: ergothioneine biosynthesis protein EgtB [Planctomycetota bacterium]